MRKFVLLRLLALPLVTIMLFGFLSISTVSAHSSQSSIKLHTNTANCSYAPVTPFIGTIYHQPYVIFEGTITCTTAWTTAAITVQGYENAGSTPVANFTYTCTPNTTSCSAWTSVPYVASQNWTTQISGTATPATEMFPTSPGTAGPVTL